MAKTNHKFGVVYGTPSQLSADKIQEGKLYFLAGDESNGIKQGIYGVNPLTSDVPNGVFDLALFGTGAIADGSGYGLSQDNFTKDASIMLKALNDASSSYLLESNYVQVDASNDGYVPKCDASDGTIDSPTKDWVLTYKDGNLGWYKLPAKAFDNGVTSVTITQGEGITCSSSGTAITSTGTRTISLKKATNSSLGGIKLGYTDNEKNYKVQVDDSGNAYVNVPWLDKAEDASHADSADTANELVNSLKVQGDGTDIISFNGSEGKTINIIGGTNVSLTKDATNGKITINADIPGALVYQGVVSTLAEINAKSCTTNDKGDVYVASANFSGTITKNGATYSIEKGDMFICNGSSWDIVNGEGQVTNGSATLEYAKSATIATVDGVNITLTGPATPVTSLGGKTGAITLGTATESNDKSVNFSIDASNKITATVPSLSKYLKSEAATSTYLSKTDASTTYLKISDASYFNTIKVGEESIVADSSKDVLTFVAGDNVTLTPDVSNDTITISATDTVYSHPAAGAGSIDTPSTTTTATTLLTRVKIDSSGHVTDTSAFNGSVGNSTTPIYFKAGVPTKLSYTIAKSVPSNAVFTDTTNTAGSTASTSKLFIIGAESQGDNPQTYSNASVYIDGSCLYSNSKKVATTDDVEAATIYWETL